MKGDFIYVKNLFVKASTGLDAWKRVIKQPLKIGIGINVGSRLRRMGLTDDIRRTLNYDSLSTTLTQKLEHEAFKDIESTAVSTLETVKAELNPGEWARVTINQPKARLLTQTREIEIASNDPTAVVERLRNLRVELIIGINDLERIHKQEVQLDLDIIRQPLVEMFTHETTEKVVKYVEDSQFLTIETFVNALAEFICEQAPSASNISEVRVCATKPSALNMADGAAVQVTRKPSDFTFSTNQLASSANGRHTVYIAFGTNQGDRISHIKQSIHELSTRGIFVEKSSAIYQSDPMYFLDQPPFLNGVFLCHTDLGPDDLLTALKDIEYNVFKRVKLFDNGPRPLDLDIILFDNELIETEKLTVPHRDMLNRSFVLRPLNDVLTRTKRYTENVNGTETVIVPLYSDEAPTRYLEFDAGFRRRQPTTLMSIMNATPDSFSDGGDLKKPDFKDEIRSRIDAGAQILDVGGYSTRPGASEVSEEEEIQRVCTLVKEIRSYSSDVIVSVDTFRGAVAKAALACGANLINDVFSGTLDASILNVAAETGAPIILSHSRGSPATMKTLTTYTDGVLHGVACELRERIDAALRAGCQTWQLILDPGLGFAKTPEQDLELIKRFRDLKHSPVLTEGLPVLPWLVGPSRKSFIGHFTGEKAPKSRVAGTIAVATALRQQGADIIRVHDTRAVSQALKMADEIYN